MKQREIYLLRIVAFRKQRFTYKKIGILLGITKQRVHQIFRGYTSIDHRITAKLCDELGGSCLVCGISDKLEIHHKDGNGKNNAFWNIRLLCKKHHTQEEMELRRLGLRNHVERFTPPSKYTVEERKIRTRLYWIEYRRTHIEKVRETSRKQYQRIKNDPVLYMKTLKKARELRYYKYYNNPEYLLRFKEQQKQYRNKNLEAFSKRNKEYHDTHKEQIKKIARAYVIRNREKINTSARVYYYKHQERMKAYSRDRSRKKRAEMAVDNSPLDIVT